MEQHQHHPRRQRLAILVVLAVGVVGVVASTPGESGDITGTSNTVSITLDADNPSEEHTVDASVSSSAAIESGSIQITADFSGAAQVHMSVSSASDQSDVDVLDTDAQPSVSLGVAAFDGCDGTDCTDTITVTFDRVEADITDPVTIDFTADGSVTVVDDGSGDPVDGTLDLSAN